MRKGPLPEDSPEFLRAAREAARERYTLQERLKIHRRSKELVDPAYRAELERQARLEQIIIGIKHDRIKATALATIERVRPIAKQVEDAKILKERRLRIHRRAKATLARL